MGIGALVGDQGASSHPGRGKATGVGREARVRGLEGGREFHPYRRILRYGVEHQLLGPSLPPARTLSTQAAPIGSGGVLQELGGVGFPNKQVLLCKDQACYLLQTNCKYYSESLRTGIISK